MQKRVMYNVIWQMEGGMRTLSRVVSKDVKDAVADVIREEPLVTDDIIYMEIIKDGEVLC